MPALDRDHAAVLRVVADYRPCRCGGWVVVLTPDGMSPRTLTAADADEATYVVQYELDVIMSETGRDLATEDTLDDDCAICDHGRPAQLTRPRRATLRSRVANRYRQRKRTHGTCPG